MAGFDPILELSSLDGANGFQISGEAAFDKSGYSVASAGDVNGDGFDDLIIGAPGTVYGAYYSPGVSYVVFGQAGGFAPNIDLSDLDGSDGFKIVGESIDDESGSSVASAGDVNGDGFDDLIIGAPGAGDGTNYYSPGASYVVFGQVGGFAPNIDLSDLDGSDGFTIVGESIFDVSGFSVASAGDVNGDGFDDVIIGAPGASPNGYGRDGASYVVFGQAGGFAPNIDLSDLDGSDGFKIVGESINDVSGFSVASAGDVNGDGFDDLIIGAPGAGGTYYSPGASYVVFGQSGGFAANTELSSLNGTNGFQIRGEGIDGSGHSVASAGDVNGDGFDDLIIGASGSLGGPGTSCVVFGQAERFRANIDVSDLDGTNGFQISGGGTYYVGHSVASAGDVNGDGFDDLIIGASGVFGPGVGVTSSVVFGQNEGFSADIDVSDLDGSDGFKIVGQSIYSASSVASAGDVNGDGFDDLIIGADNVDAHGGNSGASYVIFGEATASVTRVGTAGEDRLFGGDFNDLLRGRGGADTISGNDGNDIVFGGSGQDSTSGGAGDDVLFVILGENTLEFDDNDGADTVVGYKPGIDELDLTAVSGLANFNDLSLTARGDDVLVDYGSGSFLLKNTTLDSIEASDFLF